MKSKILQESRFQGAALVILAALGITLITTLVKWASRAFSTEFVLMVRLGMGAFIFILIHPRSFRRDFKVCLRSKILWIQSLAYLGALFCLYLSVRFVPLVDALLLYNTAPLIAPLLALIFLGEKQGIQSWIGILMGLAGAAIVLQPGGTGFSVMNLFSLGAGLLIAVRMVILSHLDKKGSKEQVTFSFHLFGLVIAAGAVVFAGVGSPAWETILFPPREWAAGWMEMPVALIALFILGGLSLVIPMLQTVAYRQASVGEIGSFRFSAIIFAGIIDWVLWGLTPRPTAYLGFILIVGGAILAAGARKRNRAAAV